MLGLPSWRVARRLKTVLVILGRYGFGEFVEKLDLPCRKPLCVIRRGRGKDVWTRVRLVLEELGPTAIKIGQAVSTRPDLIPPELSQALTGLQENVRQERFQDVAAVAEASLGRPLGEVFAEFAARPVAAASLSQVHKAQLRAGGEVVAVKIRRPRIMAAILADLDLLDYLAGLAHQGVPALRKDNLPELAAEARQIIMRELDFRNEARNIILFNSLTTAGVAEEQFLADLTGPDGLAGRGEGAERERPIVAPAVHPRLCTEEVLVMEFVAGARVDQFEADPDRRRRLAQAGLRGVAGQMLRHGFFHADPHFGNIRVLSDAGGDRLCFLDWGMVGRLTPEMRSALVDYILAIVNRDAAKVARVALDMAVKIPPLLDFQKFQTEVMFVLEKVWAPLEESANLGRFLLELTTLCRAWDIHLRSDYVLMARALINIEGAGRVISPGFDIVEGLRPIAMEYALKRRTLLFSDKPLLGDVAENVRALARLPGQVSRLLRMTEDGEITTLVEIKNLPDLVSHLTTTGKWLASGLITAALIIGSSIVFISNVGPHWRGWPVFGLIGFTLSGAFGVGLVLHMLFRK